MLVTGLGHLYLRRWRRALGWLVALFGVVVLTVEPATLEAVGAGTDVDAMALAPALIVGSLSVADAYVLARAHNAAHRSPVAGDDRLSDCPNCGRERDPDLEFCQWCTTEFDAAPPTDDSRER
jgi:hypothetical protein